MASPKKGSEKYDEYIKYQWQYKKRKMETIQIALRKEEEADLIRSLKNFDGNRAEWFRNIIREALIREDRLK